MRGHADGNIHANVGTREGVQRFRELKAKSLPSVALDGELVYESLIPMQEEMIDEIRRRYKEKNQDE